MGKATAQGLQRLGSDERLKLGFRVSKDERWRMAAGRRFLAGVARDVRDCDLHTSTESVCEAWRKLGQLGRGRARLVIASSIRRRNSALARALTTNM